MTQELPVFSIVVPSYRRPGQLAACLQAIAQLDYARERFEVIVVEDGTNTPAKAAAASFDDRLNLTLLAQSHSGPATARNSGAMRAKCKFLAFTDDDCMPTKRWLQSLAVRFDQTPDDLIGGKTINVSDDPYARTYQVILVYIYDYYNSGDDGARFLASNNLAVPADRFRLMGGFDPSVSNAGGDMRTRPFTPKLL